MVDLIIALFLKAIALATLYGGPFMEQAEAHPAVWHTAVSAYNLASSMLLGLSQTGP